MKNIKIKFFMISAMAILYCIPSLSKPLFQERTMWAVEAIFKGDSSIKFDGKSFQLKKIGKIQKQKNLDIFSLVKAEKITAEVDKKKKEIIISFEKMKPSDWQLFKKDYGNRSIFGPITKTGPSKKASSVSASQIQALRKRAKKRNTPPLYLPDHALRSDFENSEMRKAKALEQIIIKEVKSHYPERAVLVLNSGLGLYPMQLSTTGMYVLGVDSNEEYVDTSRALAAKYTNKACFEHVEIDSKVGKRVPSCVWDAIVLTDVLDRMIENEGVLATKGFIADLLEKCPMLIVEVDSKSKYGDSILPGGENAVFKDSKGYSCSKIKSDLLDRRLKKTFYLVKKNYKTVNGVDYKFSDVLNRGIVGRRYYFGKDYFCKDYYTGSGINNDKNSEAANCEIDMLGHYLKGKDAGNIPELVDYEEFEDHITFVYKKIKATPFKDFMLRSSFKETVKALYSIAQTMTKLEKLKVHISGFLPRNLMWDGKKAYIIDFGYSYHEKPPVNEFLRILWAFVYKKHEFRNKSTKYFWGKGSAFDLSKISLKSKDYGKLEKISKSILNGNAKDYKNLCKLMEKTYPFL